MLDYKADLNLSAKVTDNSDCRRHAIVWGESHHLHYNLACLRIKVRGGRLHNTISHE